jgi:hypothetical protein
MKLRALLITILIAAASPLFAYEDWSIPHLNAPSAIKPIGIEVQFQHQFTGRIAGKDAFSRLFGAGDGADACIGLRSTVWRQAQVYASYDNRQLFSRSHNEFTAGASYAFFIHQIFLRLQADAEIISYASYRTYPEKRKTGYFIRGCFQSEPFFDRAALLCNLGYNFDGKAPGMGIGADVAITGKFDIYGVFFPVWDKTDTTLSQSDLHNPFTFGIKFTTFGHQFFLFAGNATEIGSRHLMRGTTDNHLRLGFIIKRLFDFSKNDL